METRNDLKISTCGLLVLVEEERAGLVEEVGVAVEEEEVAMLAEEGVRVEDVSRVEDGVEKEAVPMEPPERGGSLRSGVRSAFCNLGLFRLRLLSPITVLAVDQPELLDCHVPVL